MARPTPRTSGWSLSLLYAIALHAAIIAALFVSWQFVRKVEPAGARVLNATIVRDPVARDPAPEQAKRDEPPPVEEAQKRKESEQLRLDAERKRLDDEKLKLETAQREKEEQRKKYLAAEAEKKRLDAERKKQDEQRKKTDQQRKEAEQALHEQLDIEEKARAGQRSTRLASEMAKYQAAIQQRVLASWVPVGRKKDLLCTVRIRQSTSGEVLDAAVVSSSGDSVFDRSVEAAVYKASPLPLPQNPELFEREIAFNFRPLQN